MATVKTQTPLMLGENYIYPLTTADQVILADGTRLMKNGTITADEANNAAYASNAAHADNAAMLGGKAPQYYIQPRNLLDNSDFTNPVNQRGATTVENSYIVDRWYTFNDNQGGAATLTPSGITLSGNAYLQQRLPKGSMPMDKPFTLAVYYSDGTVDAGTNGHAVTADDFDIVNQVRANGKTIARVALYEGEYTADNLPPYVPKGYAAELAECMRYYQHFSAFSAAPAFGAGYVHSTTIARMGIVLDVPMRTTPTVNITALSDWRLICAGAACVPTGVSVGTSIDGNKNVKLLSLQFETTGLTANNVFALKPMSTWTLSADL